MSVFYPVEHNGISFGLRKLQTAEYFRYKNIVAAKALTLAKVSEMVQKLEERNTSVEFADAYETRILETMNKAHELYIECVKILESAQTGENKIVISDVFPEGDESIGKISEIVSDYLSKHELNKELAKN